MSPDAQKGCRTITVVPSVPREIHCSPGSVPSSQRRKATEPRSARITAPCVRVVRIWRAVSRPCSVPQSRDSMASDIAQAQYGARHHDRIALLDVSPQRHASAHAITHLRCVLTHMHGQLHPGGNALADPLTDPDHQHLPDRPWYAPRLLDGMLRGHPRCSPSAARSRPVITVFQRSSLGSDATTCGSLCWKGVTLHGTILACRYSTCLPANALFPSSRRQFLSP
jgi:hypothetical protein